MAVIKNIRKSKKDQVFEILDEQGYILDDQSVKIFGNEGLYKVYEYIRMWNALQSSEEFFKDKKILSVRKGHRCHLVEVEPEKFYKCSKQFYDLMTKKNG